MSEYEKGSGVSTMSFSDLWAAREMLSKVMESVGAETRKDLSEILGRVDKELAARIGKL